MALLLNNYGILAIVWKSSKSHYRHEHSPLALLFAGMKKERSYDAPSTMVGNLATLNNYLNNTLNISNQVTCNALNEQGLNSILLQATDRSGHQRPWQHKQKARRYNS